MERRILKMTKIEPQPNEKTDFMTNLPNLTEVDFEKELDFINKVLDKFEPEQEKQSWNSIDFFGLSVSSQTEPLNFLEQTLNRLIEKHQGIFNHQLKLKMGYLD